MDEYEKGAELLQAIVRLARASREFFVAVAPAVAEPDVRDAFAYVGDRKNRLLAALSPWVTPTQGLAARSTIATAVEKLYADARRNFRAHTPATVGSALTFGEDQLLKLIERAFAEVRAPALRRLLKSHYPQLLVCRQAMWRLNSRLAA